MKTEQNMKIRRTTRILSVTILALGIHTATQVRAMYNDESRNNALKKGLNSAWDYAKATVAWLRTQKSKDQKQQEAAAFLNAQLNQKLSEKQELKKGISKKDLFESTKQQLLWALDIFDQEIDQAIRRLQDGHTESCNAHIGYLKYTVIPEYIEWILRVPCLQNKVREIWPTEEVSVVFNELKNILDQAITTENVEQACKLLKTASQIRDGLCQAYRCAVSQRFYDPELHKPRESVSFPNALRNLQEQWEKAGLTYKQCNQFCSTGIFNKLKTVQKYIQPQYQGLYNYCTYLDTISAEHGKLTKILDQLKNEDLSEALIAIASVGTEEFSEPGYMDLLRPTYIKAVITNETVPKGKELFNRVTQSICSFSENKAKSFIAQMALAIDSKSDELIAKQLENVRQKLDQNRKLSQEKLENTDYLKQELLQSLKLFSQDFASAFVNEVMANNAFSYVANYLLTSWSKESPDIKNTKNWVLKQLRDIAQQHIQEFIKQVVQPFIKEQSDPYALPISDYFILFHDLPLSSDKSVVQKKPKNSISISEPKNEPNVVNNNRSVQQQPVRAPQKPTLTITNQKAYGLVKQQITASFDTFIEHICNALAAAQLEQTDVVADHAEKAANACKQVCKILKMPILETALCKLWPREEIQAVETSICTQLEKIKQLSDKTQALTILQGSIYTLELLCRACSQAVEPLLSKDNVNNNALQPEHFIVETPENNQCYLTNEIISKLNAIRKNTFITAAFDHEQHPDTAFSSVAIAKTKLLPLVHKIVQNGGKNIDTLISDIAHSKKLICEKIREIIGSEKATQFSNQTLKFIKAAIGDRQEQLISTISDQKSRYYGMTESAQKIVDLAAEFILNSIPERLTEDAQQWLEKKLTEVETQFSTWIKQLENQTGDALSPHQLSVPEYCILFSELPKLRKNRFNEQIMAAKKAQKQRLREKNESLEKQLKLDERRKRKAEERREAEEREKRERDGRRTLPEIKNLERYKHVLAESYELFHSFDENLCNAIATAHLGQTKDLEVHLSQLQNACSAICRQLSIPNPTAAAFDLWPQAKHIQQIEKIMLDQIESAKELGNAQALTAVLYDVARLRDLLCEACRAAVAPFAYQEAVAQEVQQKFAQRFDLITNPKLKEQIENELADIALLSAHLAPVLDTSRPRSEKSLEEIVKSELIALADRMADNVSNQSRELLSLPNSDQFFAAIKEQLGKLTEEQAKNALEGVQDLITKQHRNVTDKVDQLELEAINKNISDKFSFSNLIVGNLTIIGNNAFSLHDLTNTLDRTLRSMLPTEQLPQDAKAWLLKLVDEVQKGYGEYAKKAEACIKNRTAAYTLSISDYCHLFTKLPLFKGKGIDAYIAESSHEKFDKDFIDKYTPKSWDQNTRATKRSLTQEAFVSLHPGRRLPKDLRTCDNLLARKLIMRKSVTGDTARKIQECKDDITKLSSEKTKAADLLLKRLEISSGFINIRNERQSFLGTLWQTISRPWNIVLHPINTVTNLVSAVSAWWTSKSVQTKFERAEQEQKSAETNFEHADVKLQQAQETLRLYENVHSSWKSVPEQFGIVQRVVPQHI